MKRFWLSWVQPTEDYRPLTDPPNKAILGWWCSGHMGDGSGATLVALVEAEDEYHAKVAVAISWPEIVLDVGWRFCEERATDWRPGDRFPLKGWAKERVEAKS